MTAQSQLSMPFLTFSSALVLVAPGLKVPVASRSASHFVDSGATELDAYCLPQLPDCYIANASLRALQTSAALKVAGATAADIAAAAQAATAAQAAAARVAAAAQHAAAQVGFAADQVDWHRRRAETDR